MSDAALLSPAESYGDVTAEYLALRRGAALVAGRLATASVAGSDATTFLDGLLSQNIASIGDGRAARSLLLSPQGKLRALLWVLHAGNGYLLVTETGRRDVAVGDLQRFKIRVDVALEPGPEIVEVWGPGAAETLAVAGLPVPDPHEIALVDGGPVVALPVGLAAHPRFVAPGAVAERLVAAGAVRAGRIALDAVRIEVGEPEMGVDLDDGTIPQEAELVADTVDFDKGCYLGQELVARIDSRGRVNRHLRGLVVTENVLPPVGAAVVAGEKPVGAVTSVGESLDLRAPVALALIRREVEPEAGVRVAWEGGSTEAVVRAVPLVGGR